MFVFVEHMDNVIVYNMGKCPYYGRMPTRETKKVYIPIPNIELVTLYTDALEDKNGVLVVTYLFGLYSSKK